MYKIAICGKANSGKNTLANILSEEIKLINNLSKRLNWSQDIIAFADPIKDMAKLMFPNLPKKYLFGSSKFRSEIIPEAFKNGIPLTVRQLLIDLGTGLGRSYNENIWLNAFDHSFNESKKKNKNLVIVTDVRFKNEFDHLKNHGFYQIRLLRDTESQINHSSETNQDSIQNNEFDYVVDNNGTLADLRNQAKKIAFALIKK